MALIISHSTSLITNPVNLSVSSPVTRMMENDAGSLVPWETVAEVMGGRDWVEREAARVIPRVRVVMAKRVKRSLRLLLVVEGGRRGVLWGGSWGGSMEGGGCAEECGGRMSEL